jgi:putative ATPase
MTNSYFIDINATYSNVKELREVIDGAKERLIFENMKTLVFIDEIHRFNKLQQDVLLPFVEKGTIILIGATTENPFFEVNSALISRSMVFELLPLDDLSIKNIIINALKNDDYINSKYLDFSDDSMEYIVNISNRDARRALNILEAISIYVEDKTYIDKSLIFNLIKGNMMLYDKKGDNHYDTISAFIKSIRGSDPDAAIHYLAKMLKGGEDPKFIARRMIILASEDIGLANSNALRVSTDTFNAVNIIGMPEARIILSHCAIYLALSPKSNSAYLSIDCALEDLEKGDYSIPNHLLDMTNKKTKAKDGIYQYPHDYKNGFVVQDYMPKELKKRKYYISKSIGDEKKFNQMWEKIKGDLVE